MRKQSLLKDREVMEASTAGFSGTADREFREDCLSGRKSQEEFLQKKVILRAMHLLEQMDRTEKGLREKLKRSDYPEEMIEQAIAYVRSYGYLDDDRYARNYIRYRLQSKSRRQLMAALAQKGIDRETAGRAWEEVAAEEQPDERVLIGSLIDKKCGGRITLDEKEYRRLQGFLARRGFSWENIRSVLREKGITPEGRLYE